MSIKETLSTLVGINSVSSRSNAGIVDYVSMFCASYGLRLRRFPYTDNNGVEKTNLVATIGPGDSHEIELALVGHTDTVPFDPNWKEALTLTERDGKLYGRGACDTKAFIAAMLTAVAATDLHSLKRRLALIFTADEEIGLIGAKRLAELKPFKARYAIVGEPTSLQPMRAGKGYCLAEVLVKGREAHSAYPALGASAVMAAAKLVARIERISKQLEFETHAAFEPPFTTLNVGLINGGTGKNVVAGECRFTLEWRPIPGQPAELLIQLLDTAIAEEKSTSAGIEYHVDASRTDTGFETPTGSSLVTVMERFTRKPVGTVAFGTEAAQMTELGAESVVFGPGDIREAHRTGEFVPVAELEECVSILQSAIEEVCV